MNKINFVLTIFIYLLAGPSIVQGDDKIAATETVAKEINFRSQRGCFHKGKYIAEGQTLKISGCESCTCTRGKPNCRSMDGCNYNGIHIPEGETRTVAPCQYGTCDGGNVIIAIADCGPFVPGCRYESTMTECCKKVCDGCDYNGIHIPEGETRTVAPCQYGTCDGGNVIIAIADCGPFEPGCRYESTMTECCKKICDGCDYNGIHIPEGETRTVAPCQYGTCDGGNVIIAIADCGPFVPGCRYESTMTECCKKICDGCDYNGIHIPEGEQRTVEPCVFAYCDGGEVSIATPECREPEPGCHIESTLEECCRAVCDGVIDLPVDVETCAS